MPLPAFAALASPAGVAAVALVIGERDGLPLDRVLAAAWRQSRAPRRLVTAPEGVPAQPAWAAPPGPQPPPPAVLAPLWWHIGPDGVIGLGSAWRRHGRGGVDGQLRAAQPGRAGRPGRRLRPVAELADRPGADPHPGQAGRPVRRRGGAARGRPGPAAPGPGAGRPGARRVPGGPGRRAGRAHPAGAAHRARARPRRRPGRRHRRRACPPARRRGSPAAVRRRPSGPGAGRRAGHRPARRLRRPRRAAPAGGRLALPGQPVTSAGRPA